MRDAQAGDSTVELLIFKDQLPSKTVRITSGWVNRLGILVGIVIFVTVSALILTAHYSDLARRSNPERLRALETELAALQERLDREKNIASSTPATTPNAGEAPNGATPSTPALPQGAWVWMPPLKPAATRVPIQIIDSRPTLTGRNLSVRFALSYTENDGGKQEGQIFVFVRGPSYFLTYPDSALSADSGSGINLSGGESFSVSRFRAVDAEFSLPRPGAPGEIRALIVSPDGTVLLDQKLELAQRAFPSPSASPKKEARTDANAP